MESVTHVLYLSDIPGRLPLSGAEKHVVTLVRALAEQGVPVRLVAMLWSGTDYDRVIPLLDQLEAAGVTVSRIQRRERSNRLVHLISLVGAWGRLWAMLRTCRAGVVHLHLDPIFTPLVAAAAGCRHIVYSVHNDEPSWQCIRWRTWWRMLRFLPLRLVGITHHVTAFAKSTIAWPPDRIDTIHYGVEPVTTGRLTRNDLGIPSDAFVVGFIGRLVPQKNLSVLIDALATRPDMVGVLVGDGPLRETLRRDIAIRDAKNIYMLGSIPDASRAMTAFDVFCLPSLWEGLGLVLVEAMLQGVPIVASTCGAIPEVLGGGSCGLLCAPTSAGLGYALDTVKADPLGASQRTANGLTHCADRFSSEMMVRKTIALYSELVSAGAP